MTEPTLPMSPAQQGMYFDSQLRQSADYHIAIELYTERLSRSRLTQAVSAVVAEQPALRASVARNESGPVYMIAESVEAPVRHHDLTGAEENLDKIFHTARHAPFQLNTAPLFRVVAARLSDGDRLLVVCHHLIADGQSVSILTDRIIDLARGTREITASRTDQGLFTHQNGQLSRPSPETLARRESFWSENLPRHRILQLDHWLLASPHEDAAREFRLTVPHDTPEAVRETAQEAEVSEFTVYLAAFGALLAHYAGEDQVSFASPFMDRPHLEMENSIGCFIRTLPVLIDVSPGLRVRDWGEVGMVAIGIGWFGIFLPLMHRLTGSHLWSGIATGGGVAVFAAPGNLFSSFNLAMVWPLYALQLVILGVAMSLLLSRMKGNTLFFLIPFWVSVSGSLWRAYYFAAATQLVQITLLLALTGILYLVLRHQASGNMAVPHTFPEYLEQDYTVREGAILPGRGNRGSETATGYTPAARNLATKGAL